MISQTELDAVIEDIRGIGAAADLEPAQLSDDEDRSDNCFLPRAYDIDRLHADDARDKVFVAILKALVARHNRPSSPKELATCIMEREFTLLGGATPYATVSSRISQHFKRIFEHTPPRPPILGRVAHEKHTRKYFYYVASASEQDGFQRKVRAGIIPTQPVVSSGSSTGGSAGSGSRKSTKKPRCMVPAIAVEPDLAPAASMRRARRAASADTPPQAAPPRTARVPSRSASHSGGADRRHSRTASGSGTPTLRPRRTSYDSGSTGGNSESDSDSNPYARKRYRSARSAVTHIYPRRRQQQPRPQSASDTHPPPIDTSTAPRARRSASHSDARSAVAAIRHSDDPPARDHRRSARTGKWHPSHMSDEDGGSASHGSASMHDDDNDGWAEADHRFDQLSSPGGYSYPHDESDSMMLLDPVSRAPSGGSISPDQTPLPPVTSPVFHHRPHSYSTQSLDTGLQAASPLLLPRSLMALPLDGDPFDTSPSLPCKDGIPSPTDMTPLVSAATGDSVVPAHPGLPTELTALGASPASGAQQNAAPVSASARDTPGSALTLLPATGDDGAAAPEMAAAPSAEIKTKPAVVAPASSPTLLAKPDLAGSDTAASGGGSGSSEFGFSFHELMDAELMSVNELERLWTTSNPSTALEGDLGRYSVLETIPESAEDACDAGHNSKGVAGAAANGGPAASAAAGNGELPTKLARKLLVLAEDNERGASAAQVQSATGPASPTKLPNMRLEVHSAPAGPQGDGKAAAATKACGADKSIDLDSVEPTKVLEENTDEHEGTAASGSGSKIILPDPFADIAPTAMVATKLHVSPRIVLTIVETVPVYMTVITTTEPAADCRGKWIVRRHRLLRLVENGYVNASSLLLAGGVSSEQERSIVLSLEVGRFKWRRPQSKLYGTWIPLPRARALAATCSLNHRLGPFLNDNLEAYFPAPLPTTFIRHLIMPFFADHPTMMLGSQQNQQPPSQQSQRGADSSTADGSTSAADEASAAQAASLAAAETAREAGLGIEFQNLVNSTVAARTHQPTQSISRSSTFGATARGTPSPSIIQTLAARSGSFNLASAAKAIFGNDSRNLHSFLQLLSAEGPMLGTTSMAAESSSMQSPARTPRPNTPSTGPNVVVEAAAEEPNHGPEANPEAEEPPKTPLTATSATLKCVVEELAKSTIGSTESETTKHSPAGSASELPGTEAAVRSDSPASHAAEGDSAVVLPDRSADSGVDAQKLSEAISSTIGSREADSDYGDSMDCDISVDGDDDLDMSMVIPGSDSDVDMISRSTPPSPPLPPTSPKRFRRLSNAPLMISRSASSSTSLAIDNASPTRDGEGSADESESDSAHSPSKRVQPSANGSFNARLTQTMEAFGFTGTAKANLLLRLRAAAAAKSTGRQQAVAPYLLYRSGGAAGVAGGSVAGGSKRLKGDDDDGVASGGVRKRARVIRVARGKPLPPRQVATAKSRAKGRAAAAKPDPSVVLRLASAIYNHTLNMATQAQNQRRAAETSRPSTPTAAATATTATATTATATTAAAAPKATGTTSVPNTTPVTPVSNQPAPRAFASEG
ncbi:hypothetical protein GGF46_004652 [Coemansia sp. RSA 552]|nr:hypothetical protein GGF46_004652 [Coemansia sp. RSA 552]